MRRQTQGFTIIEIMVAVALLGVLTAVLTATMTGSLSLNQQSQKQLSTSTGAQQIVEEVRKSWVVQEKYDRACVVGAPFGTGYKVEFINLSTRAQPVTLANELTSSPTSYAVETLTTGTCSANDTGDVLTGASNAVPTMRRIVVRSGKAGVAAGSWVQDAQDITLTLDVLRPQ